MPAKSKAQQRLMGMVRALQKGDLDPASVSPKVQDMARKMDPEDVKDFATTKHNGLPKRAWVFDDFAPFAQKLATVETGLRSVENAVRQAEHARTSTLSSYSQQLRQQNAKMRQQQQKTQETLQQARSESGQLMAQMSQQQGMQNVPAAQPVYGQTALAAQSQGGNSQ